MVGTEVSQLLVTRLVFTILLAILKKYPWTIKVRQCLLMVVVVVLHIGKPFGTLEQLKVVLLAHLCLMLMVKLSVNYTVVRHLVLTF